ncbi:MAG: sugar phosphate nucleotidyltransferase, partial [Planctomycetota bacterium]
ARPFVGESSMFVLLGDNLFGDSLRKPADAFKQDTCEGMVLLTSVPNPREFGIARFDGSAGQVVEIIEKPSNPPTDLAVTGAYFYRPAVFDLIGQIAPSDRGELEITDLNNMLIERGSLEWDDVAGWWGDAGTPSGMLRAANLVAERGVNGDPPAGDASGD